PNFMAMTSHNVVLASYSATSGLPLMMNVAFSFDTAAGSGGAAIAETVDWPCIAVKATPDPAAFRKFLRENLMSCLRRVLLDPACAISDSLVEFEYFVNWCAQFFH